MDHSLLFAVGAWPPHDGVRRARRLNLSRDLRGVAALRFRTLNEIASVAIVALVLGLILLVGAVDYLIFANIDKLSKCPL